MLGQILILIMFGICFALGWYAYEWRYEYKILSTIKLIQETTKELNMVLKKDT